MLESVVNFFRKGHDHYPDAAGKCILVIDDGEVERTFLSRTLVKKGYRVVTADNGEAGLQSVKKEKPDIVLLDFMMPGLSGAEVCRTLKDDEQTKDIPVIFLTGSTTPKDIIDCYEVGAEYYLAKPISSKILLKHVRMILHDQNLPLAS